MKEPETGAEPTRLRDFLLAVFADLMEEEAAAEGAAYRSDAAGTTTGRKRPRRRVEAFSLA